MRKQADVLKLIIEPDEKHKKEKMSLKLDKAKEGHIFCITIGRWNNWCDLI